METKPTPKPFPIPVVPFGPGSQHEDETLNYITLPQGMQTYRAPHMPEPEAMASRTRALEVLHAVLGQLQAELRDRTSQPVSLAGLDAADLALVNQVLGEGEVSARVLEAPGLGLAQIQESVFAGVWRVIEHTADGRVLDSIEVGAVPQLLLRAALEDGRSQPPHVPPPVGVMNAPTLLAELADQRRHWRRGQGAHVVNLTLLPMSPDDLAYLDQQLGNGRVLILSRGYGNCRISNAAVPHTWRVVYFNSQDTVILNSIEVTDLPEVACAAREDLEDSAERLAEVLAWVGQE